MILVGDVRDKLAEIPDGSVRCCVTSPPYWGLRDYGENGQLGLEPTPEQYVENLVAVFREVRRVLSDDGTLWLNLGDSYAGGTARMTGRGDQGGVSNTSRLGPNKNGLQGNAIIPRQSMNVDHGLKPKDLVGIPWRVAFALQADGWWLRSDIIWAKPNPMPESVTDRPTKSHEYLFLLSKSARYFYDADAIREPVKSWNNGRMGGAPKMGEHRPSDPYGQQTKKQYDEIKGANRRSVWTITTNPFPQAHFATFPLTLPMLCIQAGSEAGDTVLDPFAGAGTTGVAATKLGRDFIGVELNPEYAAMAERRIMGTPLALDLGA